MPGYKGNYVLSLSMILADEGWHVAFLTITNI